MVVVIEAVGKSIPLAIINASGSGEVIVVHLKDSQELTISSLVAILGHLSSGASVDLLRRAETIMPVDVRALAKVLETANPKNIRSKLGANPWKNPRHQFALRDVKNLSAAHRLALRRPTF